MNLGVQVLGDDEVVVRLDRGCAAVTSGRFLEAALAAGALIPLNAAKAMAPAKTGNLRRSLHIGGHAGLSGGLRGSTGTHGGTSGSDIGGNASGPGFATIQAGTNVEYAPDVEYGTGPHEIRPVNAKALFWRGAAHPVKVVHHPGTAPRPYMRPAFDGCGPVVAAEMARAVRMVLEASL